MNAQRTFGIRLETPEGPREISCRADEYVWDAAERQGIRLPAICHQGRCLSCAGKLLSGALDDSSAEDYFAADEAANFVLLCRGRPRSDCVIRTHEQDEMRVHRLAHGLPAPYG